MKKLFIMLGLTLGFTALVQFYNQQDASAAVCTVTNNNLTNIFPRSRLGTREDATGGPPATTCQDAESFMWMSDYWSVPGGGSPLQTPTARLRVFFLWSDVAARPDPIDSLALWSPDGSRVRCGFSMDYTYVPTGDVINVSKPGTASPGRPACSWPTFLGFVPGASFDVYKSHLQTDTARYGTNVRYVDVNLDLTTTDTNAPFRLWATGAGSTARISFKEMSLAEAQSSANGNTGSAFALWTNDLGGGAQEPVTYTLNLAPDCSIAPGGLVNVYFKWYDADDDDAAGGTNLIHPYHMYIVDDTTGAHLTPSGGLSSASYVFGDDDQYAVYGPVTLTGGHKYRWIWSEISRGNGVQVYMPFSEMNNDPATICNNNQPPSGSISLSCVYDSSRATGARIDFNVNRSDPEGDPISLVGGYSHNVGGRGFNTWSGSFDGNLGEVGNAIAQITDGTAGHETLVGGSGYTCPPNRPPTATVSASCGGVVRQLAISISNLTDPDGGTAGVRASSSGPPYSGYIVNSAGNFVSPTDYSSPARDSYLPPANNVVTHTVTFEGSDAQSGAWSTLGTATYFCYRNPTVYTCTIISSGSFEPGEQLQPIVQVDYNVVTGPLSGSVTYSLRNSVGVDVAGSPQTIARNPLGAGVGAPYGVGVFTPITLPSLGAYTQAASLTLIRVVPDDPGSEVCGGGATVASSGHPYFKIVGGDVVSSTGFVRGWNRAVASHYNPPTTADPTGRSGSGVSGAIISGSTNSNDLNGVMSSYFNASGAIKRLTFGNTGAVGSVPASTWGGGFGAPTPISLPSAPLGTPAYAGIQTGDFTSLGMNFSGGIPPSTKMTVFVDGNLTISNSVTYPATYANISEIPHIRFVVSGNIYIAPGATVLDGEYMSAGRVYTCHNGGWGTPIIDSAAVNLAAACAPTLRVNGALVGNTIRLTRTAGLLRNSAVSAALPFSDAANTAEIITFSPEIYLSTPFSNTITGPGSFDYDSVTSLPPLF